MLLNPPVEVLFAGLKLLFPFGQCSFLPQRLGLEFSFSPLGDLVVVVSLIGMTSPHPGQVMLSSAVSVFPMVDLRNSGTADYLPSRSPEHKGNTRSRFTGRRRNMNAES